MRKILFFVIVLNSLLSAQMSSPAKSKLQSLIIPGLGELNMGYDQRARSFFVREAALWLICFGGIKVSNWHESDFRAFAELHADANMDGKDYIYSVNMGHFNSMTEYNETRARQRQIDDIYEEGQGYEWQWDNSQNRILFDNMRIQSVIYEKYAKFAIGGLVLHRLISLIDVIYLERRYPDLGFNHKILVHPDDISIKFSLDL